MGTYIDATALETALTPATYLELFCDTPNSSTVNTTAVNQVIDRAEGLVDSYLLGFYSYPLDPATDRLIVSAALMFAQALAFMRHPEYVRTYGEVGRVELYKEAHAMMLRIQAAKQRLPDVGQVQTPKNVGAIYTTPGPVLIVGGSGDF